MATQNDSAPPKEEIKRQLARMLKGERFSANENPRKFLAFVVRKALRNERITQSIIGLRLFPKKYARSEIPDVRVTANNLRKVLAKYYAQEGAEDLVLITLPTPPRTNRLKLPPGKAYKPIFSYNPRSSAHKEHSRGLYLLTQVRLDDAEKHFVKAIALEPRYAEPYLSLATTYLLFPMCVDFFRNANVSLVYERGVFSNWLPVIRKLVAKAFVINRKSWRAHLIRGVVHSYQCQWEKAKQAFGAALRMGPEKTRDDPWYIAYLAASGKPGEAAAILGEKSRIARTTRRCGRSTDCLCTPRAGSTKPILR